MGEPGRNRKYDLFAILNAFMNRLQAEGDDYFDGISWKQCFVLICLTQCDKAPSLKELAGKMGCSHQNAKQMLRKLEKSGHLEVRMDELDRRVQRIYLTELGKTFCNSFDKPGDQFLQNLYQGVEASDVLITMKTIHTMEANLTRRKA